MKERADAVIEFHQKYTPPGVGYEKYGKDTDMFPIAPLGGSMGKNGRVRMFVPDLAVGKLGTTGPSKRSNQNERSP